jgi:Fe-S oxidoreductase
MHIREYTDVINACKTCFMCRHICTMGTETQHEADTPRGKAILLHSILNKTMELNEETVAPLYRCTTCGACKNNCVGNYDMPSLVQAARADVVEQEKAPTEVARIKDNILNKGNIFGLKKDIPVGMQSSKTSAGKADVLYFAGCHTAYLQSGIAEAMTRIMTQAGENFTVLPGEVCCGKPLYLLGYRKAAQDWAGKLFQQIKATGCKKIVTNCPSCYDVFKRNYEAMGVSIATEIEVLHAAEYISDLMANGKIELQKQLGMIVTYHDDDYLGRFHSLHELPRQLLSAIPGIEPVEMRWNRGEAASCGEAGGVLQQLHPQISRSLAAGIIDGAAATGAACLVTACPITKSALDSQATERISVCDIIELMADALL